VRDFCGRELEGKIRRESGGIPRDRLVEHLRLNAVQLGEVAIQHHPQAANKMDARCDRFRRVNASWPIISANVQIMITGENVCVRALTAMERFVTAQEQFVAVLRLARLFSMLLGNL